jgi:hypothetical protein
LKSGERLFGIIFTSIGIGLLVVVFCVAYKMLSSPVPGLSEALVPTSVAAGGAVNTVGHVSSSVIAFLLKLALLFVMTLSGSHIASRGIQLYHGGSQTSTVVSVASAPVADSVSKPSEPTSSPK